jgi:glycosyltransferase involved in cell wall biosynthesis
VSRHLRLALVTEIPAPYRIPIFNALAARDEIELHVLYLAERNPRRPYALHADEFRFEWTVLRSAYLARGGRWVVVNRGVAKAIREIRPDAVIVGGWNQPAFWQALSWAKLHGCPAIGWAESTARDARSGFAPLEGGKRAFIRVCDALLVPGHASAEYLAQLGVPAERVVVAPNAVDRGIFGGRVERARGDRDVLRARLGVRGTCVLSVGRLDPEKGVDIAVRAVAALPDEVEFIVAGTGPEESHLRALADRLAPGRVRFLGFVERDKLVEWYAASDVFVLPSRSEQWGMALNEAATAGLPLVASDAAGAAYDLLEDGLNGFRVAAGDVWAMRDALTRLAGDEALRRSAGHRSRELAARFTPEAWAEAVAGLAAREVSTTHHTA